MRSTLAVGSLVLLLGLSLGVSRAAPLRRGKSGAAAARRAGLVVRGRIDGLFPGARDRLHLSVGNVRAHPIRLTTLSVRIANASRACRGTNLRIGRYRGRLLVPPHSRRSVVLPVKMLRSAPDGCKRAVFPLSFSARGRT